MHRLAPKRGFLAVERTRAGASARAQAKEEVPDLILLDVLMPGETGFETCSRLKSESSTADIPIIFLSGLDDVESKVKGR